MVKKFSPENSVRGTSVNIAVVGKRNRGKSHVLIQIAHNIDKHRLIPRAAVLSSTDGVTGFFKSFFNPHFIYTDFDDSTLEKIMAVQAKSVAKCKDPRKTGLLLLIDDSGFDQQFFKSKAFRELAMNGRHYNISTVIALQDIGTLTPAIRAQLDYVLCLNESFTNGLDRLYRWVFGTYDSLHDFREAHKVITQNYGVHVFDNLSQGSNEDKVMWFRASHPLPRFKFGSIEYQKYGTGGPQKNKNKK